MNSIKDPTKLVIIEDEPISSAYLKKQLKDIGFNFKLVSEISTISAAVDFFNSTTEYDLVFMDIHLEDGDCFKILNSVTVEKPIIFCTTFDTYALKAFEYNSIAYILKPVNKNSIEAAIKKYNLLRKNEDSSYLERMNNMLESIAPTESKKRFLVRFGNKLKLIQTTDIVCFYSDGGDTRLIEKNGGEHIIDFTMERLEKVLNKNKFFRINRKTTINVDFLHNAEDYFNNRLKIKMEKNIPFDLVVSRNRVKDFKTWLKGVC